MLVVETVGRLTGIKQQFARGHEPVNIQVLFLSRSLMKYSPVKFSIMKSSFFIFTCLFIAGTALHNPQVFAQLGHTGLKIHVIDEANYKPIENAYVVISNSLNHWDTRIGITDASGDALFNVKKGDTYTIAATHEYYKTSSAEFVGSNARAGDAETYTIVLVFKSKNDDFNEKRVVLSVQGKDRDGTIKPLAGAKVYTCGAVKPTNSAGYISFSHHYELGSFIYIAAEAEGYALKEDHFIVGSKPAIPDNAELVLERLPVTTVPVQVLVLDKKTDDPIEGAYVSINLRSPMKVNGTTKTMWGADYTNARGIADFTAKTERAISTEVVANSALYADVHKENYADVKYFDIPADLLTPSEEPRMITIWMEKKSGSGLVSETLTVPNDKPDRVYTSDILDAGATYLIEASGTVSDWDTKNPEGVDACYCYIKWRCPTPEPWGQLTIDGKNMHMINGSNLRYEPESHHYRVKYTGTGKKMELYCADALGSSGDNSGKFTVTVSRQ
jgi:hypothetical protein